MIPPPFRKEVRDADAEIPAIPIGKQESDFSAWIEESLEMSELAGKFRAINPYRGSLERHRFALLTVCDEFLTKSSDS